MGFLDNSGDIILDAVLTDTGRMRLARGDGSFKITKFALGDDEIDYANYNKNHTSGSAYYDLEVLQTPILEAFTNNASSMHSKLLSISRTDLLYLPVLKLNEQQTITQRVSGPGNFGYNTFLVTVDENTEKPDNGVIATAEQGVILGSGTELDPATANFVRVDQGLNTVATVIPPTRALQGDLVENFYLVEIDNRLGKITSKTSPSEVAPLSFIDDDNMATYQVSNISGGGFVVSNNNTDVVGESGAEDQVITGPRGTRLDFRIQASDDLFSSDYYFDLFGSTGTKNSVAVKFIDTFIRITGVSTGYRIDIPIRFLKKD